MIKVSIFHLALAGEKKDNNVFLFSKKRISNYLQCRQKSNSFIFGLPKETIFDGHFKFSGLNGLGLSKPKSAYPIP